MAFLQTFASEIICLQSENLNMFPEGQCSVAENAKMVEPEKQII